MEANIKKRLLENGLTERHARALLRLPDQTLREEALDEIIKNDLNVKKTEQLIKNIIERIGKKERTNPIQKIRGFMNYKIYINTLKQAYEAIKEKQGKAQFEQIDKGEYVEVVVKIKTS